MSLGPEHVEQLRVQRRNANRALSLGRRWYLRAVLMLVIAAVALYRGGQVQVTLGVVMALLAVLSLSLGRTSRRSARQSLQKIDLMEKSDEAPPG